MGTIKRSGLGNDASFSARYLDNRSDIPQISAIMSNSVSQERRVILSDEVEQGRFTDGSRSSTNYAENDSACIVASINKTAQMGSMGGGGGGFGMGGGAMAGNSVQQTPEVYSPLWLNSNLSLPRDRATINAWCRSFFALNPFVHNAISLHSTYPISKLSIKCPNKDIEKFFNDMIEEIDLMNICVQIAQEYFLLGEAFVYAELDEGKGKWSRLHIQNPDYMVVKRTVATSEPIIMLRPDQNLKNIIFSSRPTDIEQRKQLNQRIVDCVKRGENIPLDNLHVSQLARRVSPYEIRGTGLPVCIFRQLMLLDKLRESKFAQAEGMVNPLTVIKIGSPDYKPTQAALEEWRATFEAMQSNKDAKIFTHEGVTIEKVGSGAGIYDISADITQLIKEILIGLQVPQVMLDGGADTTYANGGVALDVLRQRYMQFRNMMSMWLKRKIFAPISKIQGFFDYSGGEKQLIVPEVDWNHMSLFDTGEYINTLVQGSLVDKQIVSKETLYRSLGLEMEDENRKVRRENVHAAIAKKEIVALDTMTLNALRSLDDEDEIPEPKTASGTAPPVESPLPGETPGGGLDLGGLGGMPSMPPMPSGGGSAPPAPPPPAGVSAAPPPK